MKNINRKKILFLVNDDNFFITHRLPIAIQAKIEGFDIHIAGKKTNKSEILKQNGFKFYPLNFHRSSGNPIKLLNYIFNIFLIINKVRPTIVHAITIKPVIFGGIVLIFFSDINFVASISGLGYVFMVRNKFEAVRLEFVKLLYKLSLSKKNIKVIFQNKDDLNKISKFCNLRKNNHILIKGSGVDLDEFKYKKIPSGKPVVLFASRLLISKGVLDFAKASFFTKDVRFLIAGNIDKDNFDSLKEIDLKSLESQGLIEYLGFKENIKELIYKSSIVILPSYYREGLPKILIEAAACGRPIITTNHPGCRDAIINNKSGILVPPKSPKSISKSIKKILKDFNSCEEMGKESRKMAEKFFDIKKVVFTHMQIYKGFID
tara:strand:- start:818 stop:1945 length:1128 start_codon:yes stop_codon:yes gene_type:complete